QKQSHRRLDLHHRNPQPLQSHHHRPPHPHRTQPAPRPQHLPPSHPLPARLTRPGDPPPAPPPRQQNPHRQPKEFSNKPIRGVNPHIPPVPADHGRETSPPFTSHPPAITGVTVSLLRFRS